MARWTDCCGSSGTISLESPSRRRCVVGTSFSSRSILAVASASLWRELNAAHHCAPDP